MTTALLIIDVQTVLCRGQYAAFDIDRVLERINALSTQARDAGVPVIFVQHEEEGDLLSFASPGWQLDRGLSVLPGDLRVRKQGSDAFHQTDLHALLQARGVRHLVACGLQSEFCVDSTVRRAMALGFSVTVAGDAHSTLDNTVLSAAQISAHHNATWGNLSSYPGQSVITAASAIRFDS